MKVERPLMNYYGGKWNLGPWIISHMPKHDIYIEAFGGALSVFMQKDPARLEVVNDKDLQIASLYFHLREAAQHLAILCELTPYSRHEYYSSKQRGYGTIEDSRRTLVASYMGVGNSLADDSNGFRNNKSTSGGSARKSWKNYCDQFERFHDRLLGATVECLDFDLLFEKYDTPEALWYLDPPYVWDTRTEKTRSRAYRSEMSDEDHARLLEKAQKLQGMVLLSGYDHPLYEALPWKKVQTEARTQRNSIRMESLWMNPACEKAQSQLSMFEARG